jgi:alkanesulfonate monooxygenase SsuD/methylene tetrahydromethanopterin reductase-like flavin-dependent oxidoreductase (luciferase family)
VSATRGLGVGLTPMETRRDVVIHLAERAEQLGYDTFTVAEGWGWDAGVVLAEIAGRTEHLRLGTSVVNIWGRSAATLAMMAASLDAASDGRFTLGLGAGSPALAEGLHDVPFDDPITHLAAATQQVRSLLAGERLRATTGQRGMRLGVPPRPGVEIHLAALGPRSVRLAGELADGWDPFFLPVSAFAQVRDDLRTAARDAGRADLPTACPGIPTAVSDDAATAREAASWWVGFYLTAMGPLYPRTLRRLGFGDAVEEVVAANPTGRTTVVPESAEALLDELTLTGDPEHARATLERWYAAGAERPAIVLPPGRDVDELDAVLEALRPQPRSS